MTDQPVEQRHRSDTEAPTSAGHSDSENTYAPAPTPTVQTFLDAVLASHRDTPGNVRVELRVGAWSVMVPLSEIVGTADKLGAFR